LTFVKLQAVLEARVVAEAVGLDGILGVCTVVVMVMVALGFVERGTTIKEVLKWALGSDVEIEVGHGALLSSVQAWCEQNDVNKNSGVGSAGA
jgi:hypothetical protein